MDGGCWPITISLDVCNVMKDRYYKFVVIIIINSIYIVTIKERILQMSKLLCASLPESKYFSLSCILTIRLTCCASTRIQPINTYLTIRTKQQYISGFIVRELELDLNSTCWEDHCHQFPVSLCLLFAYLAIFVYVKLRTELKLPQILMKVCVCVYIYICLLLFF